MKKIFPLLAISLFVFSYFYMPHIQIFKRYDEHITFFFIKFYTIKLNCLN